MVPYGDVCMRMENSESDVGFKISKEFCFVCFVYPLVAMPTTLEFVPCSRSYYYYFFFSSYFLVTDRDQ